MGFSQLKAISMHKINKSTLKKIKPPIYTEYTDCFYLTCIIHKNTI